MAKLASHHKPYIHKKLIIRFRMFALIFLITLGITIYDTIVYDINRWVVTAAWLLGFGVGILMGQGSKESRDEETGKIISKMDRFGIIVLICYIAFAIFKKQLFSQWLHGQELVVFILALTSMTMLGRLLMMRHGIVQVLKDMDLL